ncbi:FAD-linked oxidoreductase [Viridothelium virens]|uniref:Proline dehydrogenase n=1 Tax=Viridothelium virens TaxID=1048519 RepID=A0A6A6GZL1_VIRVR|nr:FAD-linked oxidoreductase [Viridothelium virens]
MISGLERVPTPAILRNLLLGLLLSSPRLSHVGFKLLDKMAYSKSTLLNPDANPVLRAVVKPLFYDQFCAGTNQKEVFRTRDTIRRLGYAGVILCYGKEIQISRSKKLQSTGSECTDQALEVEQWKEGNLRTLDMVGEGDWIGLKLTGAGPGVANALMNNQDPPAEFVAAMDAICQKARSQKCRLWVDAEQQMFQTTIDRWTIDFMRKYNTNGKILVYSTIQAYLKSSRDKIKYQLSLAAAENWTLAIKLVRGAYIANDQREKIHDTKAHTDESYNSIVADVLTGRNLGFLGSNGQSFPKIALFLAGHNPESVSKAWDLIQELSAKKELKVLPDFGQLQGMADVLGCRLLQKCDDLKASSESSTRLDDASKEEVVAVPEVFKCLTWGSMQECMQYLLRRLIENQSGADRMRDGLTAYRQELWRRWFGKSV